MQDYPVSTTGPLNITRLQLLTLYPGVPELKHFQNMWRDVFEQKFIVDRCPVGFSSAIQMVDIRQVPGTNLRNILKELLSMCFDTHLSENTARVSVESLHLDNVVIFIPAWVAQHPVGLPVSAIRFV